MALIEGSQLCAGALVRASWVLTAAHCALKGKPRVILGAHKEKYVQAFPIKKAVSYPCFDPVSFEGDLQLLQGDSGSPLIREGVFRGVTSFGKRGDSRKPGVYILLTKKYLNWGRKTIAGAIGPPCLEAGS